MKRILTLILVLALALTVFAGCDKIKNLIPGMQHEHAFVDGKCECGESDPNYQPPHEHNFVDGKCECGESDPDYVPTPEVDAGLQDACDYIHQLYKAMKNTASNYTLVKSVNIGGVDYPVTWSASVDSITITETTNEDTKVEEYTVEVPVLEFGDPAINYELTFVVANAEGETLTRSYNLIVPEFKVMTFEEYYEAEGKDPVVVKGVVTGILSKGSSNDAVNGLFLQDSENKGGYYIYDLKDDPAGTIEIGMTVLVKGDKDIYNGTHEVKNASVEIVDSAINPAEPVDITELFKNAKNTSDPSLTGMQGLLVTIKGVTVLDAGDNGYYNWTLAGKNSYLRISSSNNCTTKAQEATIVENHGANFYNTADVTGLVTVYNNSIYLAPVTENAFSNFVVVEKPDDVKVGVEKDNLSITKEIVYANNVTLPTAGSSFTEVAITWALAETANATLEGNVLTPVLPESEAVTITLTATLTLNNETATKEFTVTVKPLVITSIGEANEHASGQSHNTYTADKYIIKGVITNIAKVQYGNLTIKGEDGQELYIYGIYSADGSTKFGDMAAHPEVGDTIIIWGVLGQYNGTNQMKNAWLLDWTKGEGGNEGGNTPSTPSTSVIDAPVAGTAYKFGMVQGNLSKTFYLKGGMDGYYLATTEDISAAIDVYLEETTGGYYLYTLDASGAKLYINMVVSADGAHVNGAYEAAASTVYTFDAERKSIVATVNDVLYHFGTRNDKTYTTVGPCAVSYGGFDCQFYGASEGGEVTPPAGGDNSGSEGGETPETPETVTIPQANQIASGFAHDTYSSVKYYVTGTITAVTNTQYGNMTIVDENGNTLTIYGSYDADGTNSYSAMTNAPKAGDTVTLLGVLGKFSSTNQMKNGWIVSVVPHGDCVYSEATCLLPAACVCGKISAEALGHNYVSGTCSRCGASESAISKATSVSIGDIVYIVCDSKGFEFSGFSSTSTIYGTGVAYSGTVSGAYEWTLVAGSTEGSFAFKNSKGEYLCWSSGNSAKSSTTLNANSSWTITFDNNGNAIIKNVADTTRQLQWNASSPRFAAYGNSGQTPIQLYK